MAAVVAAMLGIRNLGRGFVHAGSSHLYLESQAAAFDLVTNPGEYSEGPFLVPTDAENLFGILDSASDQRHSDEALDYVASIFTEEDNEQT
jgi:hypothetical protein